MNDELPEFTATWGSSDNPTVVLIPGAGGSQWLWTPHAEVLANEYHVVSMDMPAHGIHPDSTFTLGRAVRDTGSVLEAVESATLVGHSLGGQVAIEAASSYEERVDGVLAAGAVSESSRSDVFKDWAASLIIELGAHVPPVRAWMDDQFGLDDESQLPPRTADAHDAAVATARGVRETAGHDSVAAATACDSRMMLAYGEDEMSLETAEELAAKTGAELLWYDGGHGYPTRNPDAFVDVIKPFLAEITE